MLAAARPLRLETIRPFAVVMAGSDELEQELRSFCNEQALDHVVFLGFINQSELPRLYAASDVFVLPSEYEPWGLAVNEAMSASLPVVVSREVGCVADLVQEGVNGATPAAGNIEGLARALRRLIEDEPERRRQGQPRAHHAVELSAKPDRNPIGAGGVEITASIPDEPRLNGKLRLTHGIDGIFTCH